MSGQDASLKMRQMAFTYILKLHSGKYYVGSTDDLERRLKEHRNGKVRTTKVGLPVELVYSEEFSTRGEAQKKEYRIKNWKNKKLIESLIRKSRQQHGPIV